jgi:hypothetical protein
MRKRKTTYPVARTSRRPAGPAGAPEQQIRSTVASIDLSAGQGRDGFTTGSRVRIAGAGLYSGEEATVESIPGGVIPSVLVRTDAGRTRRVRTIDLEPLQSPPKAGSTASAEERVQAP